MGIPYQLSAYDNALACPPEDEEPPEWWQAYDAACADIGCIANSYVGDDYDERRKARKHLEQIIESAQSALEEM